MEIKSLKNIPQTLKIVKIALVVTLVSSMCISVGCLIWTYKMSDKFLNSNFIITEDGKAVLVKSVGLRENNYRKPEIINHIKIFHKLFFEVDQYDYESRINESLSLIGNSGRDLYKTLQVNGFFSTMVVNNLEHSILIDSISVDDSRLPYTGRFYGKVVVKRTDQELQKVQPLNTSCVLREVIRSVNNPHGLLIENLVINQGDPHAFNRQRK